jgi:glycine oxidase
MSGTTPKQGKLVREDDVVIVGGGVIGLSVARELAHRGEHHITLIERGEPGTEASWAAGGILGPQAEANSTDQFFRLASASRDLYPEFAAALAEETGIDVELDRTGTLYLGFTEADEQEMRRRFEWQTRAGLNVERLSRSEAMGLEPNISPKVRCALRFPNDYQVENRRLIRALIAANQKLGVNLLTNCAAIEVKREQQKVIGVETSTGFVRAPIAILAAGAWTTQIQPAQVEVEPVRGQMLCFNAAQFARHVIYSPRGYLVPRRDGRLLAGSTSEQAGFEKRVTEDGVAAIKQMAFEIAPVLAGRALIDSWAGLRPHAGDNLPVIGEDEEIRGLFYATGHYRNGILLAPITATLVADLITGRPDPPELAAFSPARFRMTAQV